MLTQIHSYKSPGYKTLWTDGKMFYVASTIDNNNYSGSNQETMVFHSDAEGVVTDWADLYVTHDNASHVYIMKEFGETLEAELNAKKDKASLALTKALKEFVDLMELERGT